MQYQQTPQQLSDMFSSNVANGGGSIASTPAMMGLWAQQQQADNMTQQDQSRQLSFDTANDPLKLQASGLANQTAEAHLPGIQAQSGMLQRQNTNEAATNDAKIADILGKYKSADVSRHVEDTASFGTRLSQMGEEAFSNPVGAAARVKAELTSMGHGDLWNSDWENSSPGLLARQLGDMGTDIQNTSAKFKNALAMTESKNTAAIQGRQIAAGASEYAADRRLEAVQALMKTKTAIANIPRSLQDYAAKMQQIADAETDPERKSLYAQEAKKATDRANALASASATTTISPKPDLNYLGVKTVGAGTPTPAFNGAQEPDAFDAPIQTSAPPAGFPAGAVQNPDGSVTYKDKTYKKKTGANP